MRWPIRHPARSALVALLVAASLPIGRAASSPRVLSSAEFFTRVDRAIESAIEGRTSPTRSRMTEIRTALGLPVEVDVNGTPVTIAGDRVLTGLRGVNARDFDVLIAHLQAIRQGVQATIDAPRAAVPDVGAALRGTQTSPSLLQRAREIWDRFVAVIENGL